MARCFLHVHRFQNHILQEIADLAEDKKRQKADGKMKKKDEKLLETKHQHARHVQT
jgi:hypothetical protein